MVVPIRDEVEGPVLRMKGFRGVTVTGMQDNLWFDLITFSKIEVFTNE